MGIDVTAFMLVGKPVKELDITKVPYYEEFIIPDGEEFDPRSWVEWLDFCYFKFVDTPAEGLRLIRTYEENEAVLGFILHQTPDWHWKTIKPYNLMNNVMDYCNQFKEMFGVDGDVILIPGYW